MIQSNADQMMQNYQHNEGFECSIVRVPRGFYPESQEEHQNNDLFAKFLDLRTEVFTKKKGWDVWLPTKNDLDQYDQFDARYVVAHNSSGEVLGGARLMRTDRNSDPENSRPTYMIKDAYRGALVGIPASICENPPPTSEEVWELTRLVANGGASVAKSILLTANEYIAKNGGTKCLFLGHPAFMKMAKGMGFTPSALGKVTGNGDGKFLAFETDVLPAPPDASNLVDLSHWRSGMR